MHSRLVSFFAVALFLPLTALASSISIMPLGGIVPENQKSQTVTLTNFGTNPARMQVRAFAWSQITGKDELSPTRDLLVSPGVVDLPPGAKRVIRLQRVGPTPDFRVKVSELPQADVSQPASRSAGMRVYLEYSLPFLFEPAEATPASVSAAWDGDHLILTNGGGKMARVSAIGPVEGDPWPKGQGDVLPGMSVTIPTPANAHADRIRLTVNGAAQTIPAPAAK